jgi:hypothetical protein
MQEQLNDQLLNRIERLERSNRRLTLACCACLFLPVLALVGWQNAAPQIPDVAQVHKLEIVDQRGVPMVTIDTGRSNEGGGITLRDKDGERRAWWTASPDGSHLALVKEKDPKSDGTNTAGFSVTQNSAEMNLIGPGNGMFSATVRDDQPHMEMWNSKGKSLFAAPWK